MPDHKRTTSDRHTGILNAYQAGTSSFNGWAREMLGDIRITSWAYGEMDLTWVVDGRFVMPDGIVFGGHIAAVSDHLAGLVAMTVLTDDAERFRTSRLETNFFRPLTAGEARVAARIVNASASLIHADIDIFNAEGKQAVRVVAVQARRRTG